MPWIIIHVILGKKKYRGKNILKTKQLISSVKIYYRSKDDEPVNISQHEDNSSVTILFPDLK